MMYNEFSYFFYMLFLFATQDANTIQMSTDFFFFEYTDFHWHLYQVNDIFHYLTQHVQNTVFK